MFNTIEPEKTFLSDIQEAEGYDGVEGIMRIISENYENEMTVNRFMTRADIKEMRMLSESASEEDIQAHQEASVSGVYNYLKGVLQRFWAKIKAVFMKFYRKIRTWFAKRIEKKAKDNKKKVDEFWNKLKTYTGEASLEIKGIALAKNINAMFYFKTISYETVASIVASKGLDDSSDLRDEAFKKFTGQVFGKEFDYSDFKSVYHGNCFTDTDDLDLKENADAIPVLKAMSNYNMLSKLIKDVSKNIKTVETGINKEIKKVTKKQKISGESEQLKYENKAISLTNTFVATCSNAYFREMIYMFGQASKIINFAIGKSFAVNKNAASTNANP